MTSDTRKLHAPLTPRQLRWRLVSGLLLLNFFVVALTVYSLYRDYQQHQRRMVQSTQSVTVLLQQQIGAVFDRVNLLLHTTAEEVERQLASGGLLDKRINSLVEHQVEHVPEILGMRLTDAQGIVRYGLDVVPGQLLDASDREHFVRQRDDPKAGLVIAKPTFSRTNQQWVIPLSRRLNAPDGSFAGIIYASIPTRYLADLFIGLHLGDKGLVTLHNLDSVVLARYPVPLDGAAPHGRVMISKETQAFLASGQRQTSYRAVSPVDGVERSLAIHRVANYPLYVLVGQSEQEYMRAWWRNVIETSALMASFAITSVFLAWLLYRTWRREMKTTELLRDSEQRWSFALESGDFAVWDWDMVSGKVELSKRGKALLGYGEDEVGDTMADWERLSHPDDLPRVRAIQKEHFRQHTPNFTAEFRMRAKDGGWRWLLSRGMVVRRAPDGKPLRMIGTQVDLSKRRQREEELQLSAAVFQMAEEAMVVTGPDNCIISVNPAFTRITGYTPEEVIGQNPGMLSAKTHSRAFYEAMWRAIIEQGGWSGEVINRRKNGEVYVEWLSIRRMMSESGELLHHVAVFSDITARKAAEERMQHLALHDVLTDLPNRALLVERTEQAILRARREKTHLGLLFFDLDKFKPVNDTHGHEVGDMLLKTVADRVSECVRASDTVARLGGDEFVVLLPTVESEADALLVAEKIRATLNQSFHVAGRELEISTSIGLALFPEHGQDHESLMRHADAAMYRAKQAGRNRVMVHQTDA